MQSRFQRPIGFRGVVERAFASFETAQPGEVVGNTKRLRDRLPLIGQLREHADRADALHGSAGRFALACDQAQQRGFSGTVAAD
jgi:hypothetical protein